MKYRYLGHSGLAVSKVCLGTMTFGQSEWGTDASASEAILNAFAEVGGNFIDTADRYTESVSEQIIGRWLSRQTRDDYVISTKCFFATSTGLNRRGLSRKHIISACEASLQRLQTEYIDLYHVHGPDPQTPIEETMSALDTLVHQGKVRYIGCSNYPAWKITRSSCISRCNGLAPFVSGQYLYNLLKRDVEEEVLPACIDSGMSLICWSPLSGGMLTGKYCDPDSPPEGTRLAVRSELTHNRYKQWYEKSNNIVSNVSEIARRHAVTSSVVALAWLLRNEPVAAVIVGAKKTDQIRENAVAADWQLSEAEWVALNEVSHKTQGYPCEWIENATRSWFDEIS